MDKREKLLKRYRKRFDAFLDRPINYDISRKHEYTEQNGWHIDQYNARIPNEAPGAPMPDNSFELAKAVLYNYEFPPPTLITGIFIPNTPLAERVMLLRAQFLYVFRFFFGVRISRVIDEVRETKEGDLHVWGYSYQTLEGHWEMGEITFEIQKLAATGVINFHIEAYSKVGRIPNPLYRFGFWLFGRQLQIYFSRQSLKRMQRFVGERLLDRPISLAKPSLHVE